MSRRFCLFLFAVCLVLSVYGSDKTFVSERVFLAPANAASVFPGDTLLVNGQVLSTDYSDFFPYSRYVYVEIADADNNVIVRQKVRCSGFGKFSAAMPLDGKLKKGLYRMRGYTQFMRNRPNVVFPTMPLYIGIQPEKTVPGGVQAMLFPEGGHLVDEAMQSVGLFLCDASGMPLSARYSVMVNSKDTVCAGKTSPNGLAMFAFAPQKGTSYEVGVLSGGETFSFAMPPAEQHASAMRAYVNRGRLVCNVLGGADGYRIFAYHNAMGLKELVVRNNTAMADIGGIAPGLLTVWLTDGTKKPVAQRVLWVDRKDDDGVNIGIHTSGKPGGRIEVALPEDTSVVRNVFVRVVPEWEGRKPLSGASVQLYSPVSGIGGIVDADSAGRFSTSVDDYLDGTKFFVQAYNQKGRPGEYEYEIDRPDFPPFVAAREPVLPHGLALQRRYVERVAAVDMSTSS